MARKLFCQLSPFCYRISVEKEIMLRNLRDLISPVRFAEHREEEPLPALIKGHRFPHAAPTGRCGYAVAI